MLTRTDARVDFDWAGGSPAAIFPKDSFSARWDGEIEALYSEPLTLIARTDDGVRLWINGSLVIDAWVIQFGGNGRRPLISVVGSPLPEGFKFYRMFKLHEKQEYLSTGKI